MDSLYVKNNTDLYITGSNSCLEGIYNTVIVLTLDHFTTGNYEGIKVMNVLDWLMTV